MNSAAVIGASGGIGRALVEHFCSDGSVDRVYAFSRQAIEFDSPKVISAPLDTLDESSIKHAASSIDSSLSRVVVATGLLHNQRVQPEKSARQLSLNAFNEVFNVNTFGPALVAKHFVPLLSKDSTSVFAALSARVGSISDNGLGGWYAYRASKTALNMLIKCLAIEFSRSNKKACIVGLHPGTVDTALSTPFQKNVPDEKLFTAAQSAKYLIDVINQRSPSDSGNCFAWDGQKIPA